MIPEPLHHRVYFAFLPLDTDRPGGPWWYEDFDLTHHHAIARHRYAAFVNALRPVATGVRVVRSDTPLPRHHHMRVYPPADADVLK